MTDVIPGSVLITPTQMYDEMRATREQVQRLANLVDPALGDIRADVTDHETRIRHLERKVWVAAGVAAGAGAGIAQLAAALQTGG